MGKLKRYPNPAKPGAFLLLDDGEAKRLGLFGRGEERVARAAPIDDPTEGSAPEVYEHGQERTPKGALPKAGPTHRARLEAEQAEAEKARLVEVFGPDALERLETLTTADPVVTYLEIKRHRGITDEELAALGDEARTLAALEALEARATLTEEELAERLAPPLEEQTVTTDAADKATPAPDAPAGAADPKDKARPAPRGGRRRRPAGEAPAE